ncbi:MAG: hypothetical protein H8E84_00580 [Flavobacteriales bacterium]|nr:hypothetical protein [Flavobacteriales bacterium]
MDQIKEVRIARAKEVLCKMFDVEMVYLENNTNRKSNIMEARRFLIYYLRNEIGITYHGMKIYIKSLHHSTAIHHCIKMDELMDVEKGLKRQYNEFVIESNELDMLNVMLNAKRDVAKAIMKEIKGINNQIKEKRNENYSNRN